MPRKPSGRPPGRPAQGMDRRVTIMFEPEMLATIEEIAKRKGQTISSFIRLLAAEAIERERGQGQ